ncbi:hypothetical protein NL676_023745 [Syzygium grande]|nr:hypothetical protein NL676_023745 [Syzygium grande]
MSTLAQPPLPLSLPLPSLLSLPNMTHQSPSLLSVISPSLRDPEQLRAHNVILTSGSQEVIHGYSELPSR